MRFDVEAFCDERIGVRYLSEGDSGIQLVCDCPFCGKERKLYIARDTGLWTCYRCGESGSLPGLVAELDGLTYSQARRAIREGGERFPCRPVIEALEAMEGTAEPAPEPDKLRLPEEFVPIFDRETSRWAVPAYLKARNVHPRLAAAYGLGYCSTGRYGARLILPAMEFGELVTFQGRSMVNADPKYLNPVTPRGAHVHGLDEACPASTLAIVEGPFDVLGCARAGIPAVALLGKLATPAQAVLLRRAGVERAVVMLDPEASREGALAAQVLASALDEVAVAQLPEGTDPGCADRETILDAFRRARQPSLRDRVLGSMKIKLALANQSA